ncbi:Ig-like domain-containing protein [Gramella jeungdoensis]|uniref:Ig-like domain-containing protein n=1 Tax=Gramella jeungdoensis TaxID=708091 RepID=A0ABT0Z5C8_9FLAO|nr:Ig-like domain-containing protein [Gramella jeungdoensis]MCM8570640.1 Ig-like domain-containing protein [Gramella jeungdoensis]
MISAADICYSKGFPLGKACTFFLLFFVFFIEGFGQDPSTEIPSFTHLDSRFIDGADADDTSGMVLAVDTDSEGNVYILTFGKGVFKYNYETGSYEKIINDQLGDPGQLNAPLDLALDSNDVIYIADSGSKLIKKFDTSGASLGAIGVGTGGDGRDEFWQPTGLEFDRNDNLYIVDAYRGDNAAVTERYFLKIYYADGNFRSWQGTGSHPLNNPYRVAANDDYIFIGHAENNGETLVFNKQLEYVKTLDNIGSTGSIFIDNFDFVYVVDYADRIELNQVFELVNGNLGFFEILGLYNEISAGIAAGDFKIQVYNSSLNWVKTINDAPVNSKPDDIQFPVDIALDDCDKMYLNDGELDGLAINFNLEIYERSPSNDIVSPIAQCVGDFELQLVDGSASISVDDINNGSTDNCGIADITLSQSSFTDADVGENTVTMTVTDNAGNQDTCTVQVTVTGEEVSNQAPIATADSYSTDFETTLTVSAANGVLSNDTDPDGDALTAQLQTDVSNGSLNLDGDGSFTYTPNTGFSGEDTFIYIANDGELDSNEVTVTITVNPEPNQAPTATADSYSTDFETTLTVSAANGVLSNDTDPDGDALIAQLQTDVSNGTLNLNEDGSFTYTPDTGFSGEDTFTYIANDGELDSNEVTVTITVNPEPNQAPTAVADSYATGFETTLTVSAANGVLSNDTDPDGDALTAQLQTDVSNGSLNLDGDGSFTYTPNAGFSGDDAFTYIVNDGELNSNEVTVTITVNPEPNQAPTAVADSYATGFETTLTVSAANGVLSNDTDPDGDALTAQLQTDVSNGSLNLDGDGSFTYTPDTGFSGEDSFTYLATDGELSSNVATVTINVSATLSLNCPGDYEVFADENCQYFVPDFSEIVEVSPEGATIEQSMPPGSTTITNADPFITITASYEGQTESCDIYLLLKDEIEPAITCISDQTVTVNEGETYTLPDYRSQLQVSDNCENYQVVQDPAPRTEITEDTEVSFTVTDQAGNMNTCGFQLNLITEGSLSIACPSDKTESLDDGCSFEVPDYTGEAQVTNGGGAEVSQEPAPGTVVTGSEFEVFLRVEQNGESDECSFLVTLEDTIAPEALCVSDYEIILNEGDTVNLDPLRIDNGSSDNCGDISLSLDKTEFTSADEGANTVMLTVTDLSGNVSSCETTVQVTVSNIDVNQPPVAYDEEYTTEMNTMLSVSASNGVLVNDTDPENDELTAILDTDVENGTLQLNADGSFTYTPDTGFVGQDYFTYVANDGEYDSNTIFVSINVVDSSGEFGCTSQVVLGLGPEGEASLDIGLLYHGNAEGIELSADQLLFDCNDIGENTVTLTYTGRLEGSCEIPVMVVDDTPPVLQLRDISIDLNLQGVATISFEDINNGSYDECDGDVIYTLSKMIFSCKDLGENIIQVTAEDESGNTATASTIVRVFAEQEICSDPLPGSEYIFIYPNPNSGSFKIATPGDVSIQRVEIFDKRGRFIMAKNFESTDSEYAMDLGPLQEAVYVLKLETNEGVYVKRMIFKRD